MRKNAVITPIGMNRDLAMSKFDARFAYENRNLRLVTDRHTSKFVLTNEKGPAEITVKFNTNGQWIKDNLKGTVLGVAVIGNKMAVFTHGIIWVRYPETGELISINRDYIYRVDFEDGASDGAPVKGYLLYEGDLNFDLEYPIEAMTFYEAEEIQKVYWTDGKNQPRLINIMQLDKTYNDKSFDYAQEIGGSESMSIERINNSNGLFPSGTIQYAFTYYHEYAQESSVVSVSDMHYLSDDERGSAPDENVACSFRILMRGLRKDYDGVRLYSIVRISKDGLPIVKRLADLSIDSAGQAVYVDTNRTGEDMESTYLLYVGAKDITCQTMTQKDNTAFYGNIKEKHYYVSSAVRAKIKLGTQVGGVFNSLGFRNNKEIALSRTLGKYEWESQLDKSASEIRYFKYHETYRFGVQFQDRYGNWSDVVRIESGDSANGNDFLQNLKPQSEVKELMNYGINVLASDRNNLKRRLATFGGEIRLVELGSLLDDYVAMRPVVVYPDYGDRSVLAQGILTPSLYNIEDRVKGGVYGMMSWFSRPLISEEDLSPADIDDLEEPNRITRHGGLEVRHFHPLPPTNRYYGSDGGYGSNAELVNNYEGYIANGSDSPFKTIDYTIWANVYPWQEKSVNNSQVTVENRASHLRSEFFVDQSIETFHSPEVEYLSEMAKMDMDGVKMRIVGLVPLTYHNEGVYMAAERIAEENYFHTPKREVQQGGVADTYMGQWQFTEFGGIQADFHDDYVGMDEENHHVDYYGTNKIYPFHTKTLTYEEVIENYDRLRGPGLGTFSPRYICESKSTLQKKIYDSIRYSFESIPLDDEVTIDIDKPSYFNTVDSGLVQFEVDGGAKIFDFSVNRMVVPNVRTKEWGNYEYTNHFVYPGIGTLVDRAAGQEDRRTTASSCVVGTEAVPVQYRGTTGMVLHLKSVTRNNKKEISALPKFGTYNDVYANNGTPLERSRGIEWADNTESAVTSRTFDMSGKRYMWDTIGQYGGFTQKSVIANTQLTNVICGNNYGIFYLAELYRDDQDIHNRFGGESEEALAANTWIVCGEAVSLRDSYNRLKSVVQIEWSMGDTYYQRYDNLHTIPNTEEDLNQIVDIVSFMCETRVNIDGRYDRNRGLENNENTRPTNSNRINEAYGQTPNYFQYRALDHRKKIQEEYPMTVAWTKTKQKGEFTDVFTNITLANTIDMDGAKGAIRGLVKHFDDILTFQDSGVGRILFNEQQAVQTESGVPLEIANSGKVTGSYYLNEHLGCHNKWSIVKSPLGTYFMDDGQRDLFYIDSQRSIHSIGVDKGLGSWAKEVADMSHIWGLNRFECLRGLYDKKNSEVMFVTRTAALSYSEQIGYFTSFYDYEGTPFMESVLGHEIMLRTMGSDYAGSGAKTILYEHNAGRYNYYFGSFRTYWTELICHSDGSDKDSTLADKTWTNVSFQFDTFDDSQEDQKDRYKEWEHFDRLDCMTEYQQGTTTWEGLYPRIAKKFRMWHSDMPRDGYTEKEYGQMTDRFRNPWIKLRLTKTKNLDKDWRSVLHSVIVGYLE
jgi:hypothetical protein